MLAEELDYNLPPDRIAAYPAEPRDAARLMVIDRRHDRILHRHVRDLTDPATGLEPGDLLVFNQTRVLPAAFTATRRDTGGCVKGLFIGTAPPPQGPCWRVMIEAGGRIKPGEHLQLTDSSELQLIHQDGDGQWVARLASPDDTPTVLEQIGTTPLPPYIRKQRRRLCQPELEPADSARYNTVYASQPGSVAAPTAGLHFTGPLLRTLTDRGLRQARLTLHVGPGTFAPIRSPLVENHPIHREWVDVPREVIQAIRATRANGKRIIPVGTTSVRALESLPTPLPENSGYTGHTDLFITPRSAKPDPPSHPSAPISPPVLRFTDGLITNFHLPRSTLLALVAALPGVGVERLKHWYRIAIDNGYRFYSYGDAMLIL